MAKEIKLFGGKFKLSFGKNNEDNQTNKRKDVVIMTSESVDAPHIVLGLISSSNGYAATPIGFLQTKNLSKIDLLKLAARKIDADAVIAVKQNETDLFGTAIKFIDLPSEPKTVEEVKEEINLASKSN